MIINNGSAFLRRLQKVLKNVGIPYKTYKNRKFKETFDKFEGVIISGGVSSKNRIQYDMGMIKTSNVPILGICLGAEQLALAYGGTLIHRVRRVQGFINVKLKPFELIKEQNIRVYESHIHNIELGENSELEDIGLSEYNKCEILRHKSKKQWGVQFHPEKSGVIGTEIIVNFVKECGLNPNLELVSTLNSNEVCPSCGAQTAFTKDELKSCVDGHRYKKSQILRYIS